VECTYVRKTRPYVTVRTYAAVPERNVGLGERYVSSGNGYYGYGKGNGRYGRVGSVGTGRCKVHSLTVGSVPAGTGAGTVR